MTAVLVVENPYTDPITVAYSKLDARSAALAESDAEIERLHVALAKVEDHYHAALKAIPDAEHRKAAAVAAVAEAQAELDAEREADPELAETVAARREIERASRIAELEAALAALKGK
jgi:hypothetical protein